MKKILLLPLSLLIPLLGGYNAYTASVAEEMIRFHIIADSNSSYDQLVKMNLRNYILSELPDEFLDCRTKEEALDFLRQNTDKIQKLSVDFFDKIGYDKSVEVSITKEIFPRKSYYSFTLPQGNYHALKIKIGRGKGKNFFCIMFPQACICREMTDEVKKILDSKKIIYKFRISEIIKGD